MGSCIRSIDDDDDHVPYSCLPSSLGRLGTCLHQHGLDYQAVCGAVIIESIVRVRVCVYERWRVGCVMERDYDNDNDMRLEVLSFKLSLTIFVCIV